MSQNYTPEFKKKIIRLHEEGRTYKSITAEYDAMKEILRLRKELEESKKENLFLKKPRHSLRRKSIRGLSISSNSIIQNSAYAGC